MAVDVHSDFRRYLATREVSPRTVDLYSSIIDRMERYVLENYGYNFNFPDLAELRGYMISQWATTLLEFKATTRTLYLTAAKLFLSYLYSMQYVTFDLSTALPKPPSLSKHLSNHPDELPDKRDYTQEELGQMLETPGSSGFSRVRERAFIAFALGTGMRVSELLALTVGDVADEPETVSVPRKGSHGHKLTVSVSPNVWPFVREYLHERILKFGLPAPDAPLWVSNRGTAMTPNSMWVALARIQKRVGCPTGTHTFRHTVLTTIAKVADPVVSRDAAGQKSISVNNRYLHSTRDEIRQAVTSAGEILIPENSKNRTDRRQ